jgi:hypothetical protein
MRAFDPLSLEALLPKACSVRRVPRFHNLAFDHAVDVDGLHRYTCTAGNDPSVFFLIVGTAKGSSGNYLVAFGYLFLNTEVVVGKRSSQVGYPSLQVLYVGYFPWNQVVVYEVGSQQLVSHFQIALVDGFF